MACKYNWWNLPTKIKEETDLEITFVWNRIPTELTSALRTLEASKPTCYAQFFQPNEKVYWGNLIKQMEKICNLIDCVEE